MHIIYIIVVSTKFYKQYFQKLNIGISQVFYFKFYRNVFSRAQLTIRQHWLGVEQMISHYLHQCPSGDLAPYDTTKHRWIIYTREDIAVMTLKRFFLVRVHVLIEHHLIWFTAPWYMLAVFVSHCLKYIRVHTIYWHSVVRFVAWTQ